MRGNVPEVREALVEMVKELREFARRLTKLEKKLHREKMARKAPRSSTPIDKQLATEIAAYAAANPKAPMHKIASLFNVNQGRVSDIVREYLT